MRELRLTCAKWSGWALDSCVSDESVAPYGKKAGVVQIHPLDGRLYDTWLAEGFDCNIQTNLQQPKVDGKGAA